MRAEGEEEVLQEEGRGKEGQEKGETWAVRKYSAGLAWLSEAHISEFLLPFHISLRVSSGRRSGFGGVLLGARPWEC